MPVFRTLAAALLTASLATAADLTTLANSTNKTVPGELISLNAKECVFKGPAGPITTPLPEVVSISLAAEPQVPNTPHVEVELTDGSVLRCKPDGVTFAGQTVTLQLLSGSEMVVPLTALSYLLKGAESIKVRDHADWKALLKKRRDTDALVTLSSSGDRLNDLAGTVTEGKGTVITFKATEEKFKLPPLDFQLPRIRAFLFANKADLNRPTTTCRVVDTSKNVILASMVEVKDGGDLEVTTLSGAGTGGKFVLPRAQVVLIDYSKGRYEYLSEIEPTIAEEPLDDFLVRYRFFPEDEKAKRNKTLGGTELRLDGHSYAKGLCLPAPTVLVYDLKGDYKEFAAVVGVDEVLNGDSHARLVIEGDGVKLLDEAFDRARKPANVRINVKDIQKLRISVKSAGVLDLWNHLDIADAKVTK